jgi:hypothetical protein
MLAKEGGLRGGKCCLKATLFQFHFSLTRNTLLIEK